MDPFTQRMLDRARARQEKIDQKLASSGQVVTKRKPLAENVVKADYSTKSPSKIAKETVISPRRSDRLNTGSVTKSPSAVKQSSRRSSQKSEIATPQRLDNVIVTKKEFKTPKRGIVNRRNSDVSVEINIMHRDDIQIEVQVEERDAPMNVLLDSGSDSENRVVIKEIEYQPMESVDAVEQETAMTENRTDKPGLRHNFKSRLDRLGNLYSDDPNLSSPIHRTELEFTSATPPREPPKQAKPAIKDGKKKFGRLAALATEINNWEDDLTHHSYHPPEEKEKQPRGKPKENLESPTLDVSIHSINDINKALELSAKKTQKLKPTNFSTYTKPNDCRLDKKIVAQLEPTTGSNHPNTTADMATLVAGTPPNPAVTKKPSIKKYKAPTPPNKVVDDCESDKDKENNAVQCEDDQNSEAADCVQTKADEKPVEKASPVIKRLAPKLNGNIDRSSVLSKAAMFEAGSPKIKEKDPAEMSLRERKALFEKNKGAAIIPKAPFGLAPSVKTLHGENKAEPKPARPIVQPPSPRTPTKSSSSTSIASTSSSHRDHEDNISQNSVGGGIRGKLAALFSKEQTISESTITNKFKLEREREMEMLQNRFNYKSKPESNKNHELDEDQSDPEDHEGVPLMGSSTNISQNNKKPEIVTKKPEIVNKKPEIISKKPELNNSKPTSIYQKPEIVAHAHKLVDKEKVDPEKEIEKSDDKVPVKRRSSQDSPVVLSVLEDVKRIKVNEKKENANGVISKQPASLYPHLSDIETDNSRNEEYSDCGGSSENLNDKLNKSDNWAETSFGREVMKVVKRNNKSYQRAVRESDTESSQNDCDSELDEMLDEALNDSEGPTPPKVNKEGLSSKSFVYQERSFKSPLKEAAPAARPPRQDRGGELVHSVSLYRRAQNNASTPSTPMRIIRRDSHDAEVPTTPAPVETVTTVREKIKELQAEISKQQTIISQASQALNLCASTIEFSGSTEQAEGEKLLLLASHRRQACVHEVQRLQVEGAGAARAPGMATLHIRSLNVPLKRQYIRQLNAEGAVGHHCVCLVKCRDRVLATSMQRTQPASTALHFPDDIRMEGLASDFKVTVEIYLLQASKEILPHDVKYHISRKANSKLLTPKSKVSELKTPKIQSPAGPAAVRSPQFLLHGYCIFALQQANRKSFALSKLPPDSPVEGSINLDIAARLRVPPPAPHSAFLTAFDDVSGLGAWHRRWFRLQPPTLAFWKYPDDVTKKMPIGDIDLSTVVSDKVIRAPRDLCARPNTILFESAVPAGLVVNDSGSLVYVKRSDGSVVRRHLLAADTPKDRDIWLDSLNNALEYVRCLGTDDE